MRAGFVMFEAVVGVFIFMVGFLALLSLFPTARASAHQARMRVLATHLAHQHLENWIARGTPTTGTDVVQSVVSGTAEPVTFSYVINSANVVGDLVDVWCDISWTEGTVTRHEVLETEIST